MIILGAGLAGCIAGHMFPGSMILERGTADQVGSHKALLRFRSGVISRITGIPFRKVQVHKNVVYGESTWGASQFVPIDLQNMYSRKVTGGLSSRSIWDLQPVERYVAPEDFHARMVKQLNIKFSWEAQHISRLGIYIKDHSEGWEREENDAVISTLPLPVMLGLTHITRQLVDEKTFMRLPISVQRWKIKNCDLYQTIYFPDPNIDIYRASITGDTLIVEAMGPKFTNLIEIGEIVLKAFDLTWDDLEPNGEVNRQEYGKIVSLADDARHNILMELTQQYCIYSLGRFATWRNILLDDLPQDADRIRSLMAMSEYRRNLTGV